MKTFYKLIKCLIWFILTFIIAFSQDWTDLLISLVNVEKNLIVEEFIRDGVLLFFSIVLISSLTLDYFLFRKCKLNNIIDTISDVLFSIFPILMILTCASLFYNFHEEPLDKINITALAIIEVTLVFITAIYSIFIKYLSLLECEK
jgi:hypothetical protein